MQTSSHIMAVRTVVRLIYAMLAVASMISRAWASNDVWVSVEQETSAMERLNR